MKILADAMGLGKTIMTISLLLAHSERSGSLGNESTPKPVNQSIEADQSPTLLKKAKKFPGFDKLVKQQTALTGGGNLIICPMTLLGQWKVHVMQYDLLDLFILDQSCTCSNSILHKNYSEV